MRGNGFKTSSMAGIYYFMNNNRYDGMWFQDYQHGKGTMYYYNGDIYEGDWVNDKRKAKERIPGRTVPSM